MFLELGLGKFEFIVLEDIEMLFGDLVLPHAGDLVLPVHNVVFFVAQLQRQSDAALAIDRTAAQARVAVDAEIEDAVRQAHAAPGGRGRIESDAEAALEQLVGEQVIDHPVGVVLVLRHDQQSAGRCLGRHIHIGQASIDRARHGLD